MTKKLINRLEELADEMKVIVHQLRVPSTIVEDVIEFEGRQYKKVNRKACDGDVVVFKESNTRCVTKGKPYKAYGYGSLHFNDNDGDGVLVYGGGVAKGTLETVDVYELMDGYNPQITILEESNVKSPNQQRAEVIEKAKAFVEVNTRYNGRSMAGIGVRLEGGWVCIPEFIVNEPKRTVVVLFRLIGSSRRVQSRGIAKCMPTDVFNEHIGKAIALGRALGLDVSEFENAVQPTEIVVGMKIEHDWSRGVATVTEIINDTSNLIGYDSKHDGLAFRITNLDGYSKASWTTIINDTNAEYEVNA